MTEDRIKKMVGKYWMYKAKNVLIEDVKITPTKVSIILEKDVVQYDYKSMGEVFEDFLPTSQSVQLQNMKNKLPVTHMVSAELFELTETVKESIKKLKTDKDFIPQANTINATVNTLINMAKFELLTHKLKD